MLRLVKLEPHEQRSLLDLARRAIQAATQGQEVPGQQPPSEVLKRPAGAFVSLHKHGRLRGCIGNILPSLSLWETVRECALAAAFEDPRFDLVTAEELPDLEIEISVLSALEPIRPEEIRVGTHGLLVTQGPFRGLLLPQVATQYRWNAQQFLEETCLKAGLNPDAWKDPTTRIEAFTAFVFSESQLAENAPSEN